MQHRYSAEKHHVQQGPVQQELSPYLLISAGLGEILVMRLEIPNPLRQIDMV
jgi:hypothetical protein